MNVNVGGAGDAGDPLGELLGDLVVGIEVAPDHLQVDGRGQTEVQNLRSDVGRLEKEDGVREFFLETLAELDFVIASGVVFLFERDQDFAVGAGDGGDVALGKTGPTVRDTDVIDERVEFIGGDSVADFALNGGETHFGLFDASAGGSARVQLHLAGVDIGEEILADEPGESERSDGNGHEGGEHRTAMAQGPIEQADVAEAQALEEAVE